VRHHWLTIGLPPSHFRSGSKATIALPSSCEIPSASGERLDSHPPRRRDRP
jgi:hypothetical protein